MAVGSHGRFKVLVDFHRYLGKVVKPSALLADQQWLFKSPGFQSTSYSLSELSDDLMFLAGGGVSLIEKSRIVDEALSEHAVRVRLYNQLFSS